MIMSDLSNSEGSGERGPTMIGSGTGSRVGLKGIFVFLALKGFLLVVTQSLELIFFFTLLDLRT